MNSASVLKFEYKLLSEADFTELTITPFTGTIKKGSQRTDAGTLHTTKLNLRVPEVSDEKTGLFDSLLHQKAQYRVTDGNMRVHLVGDSNYPARMDYEMAVDAQPGSWNGYTVDINHLSPYSYPVSG